MTIAKYFKLVTPFAFITLILSGCVHVHQVDKTILKEQKERSQTENVQINVYREDKLLKDNKVLVYENDKLIGEVAGGEKLSWFTAKGTKNISTGSGKYEDCFMLNFPCIFNSDSKLEEPIRNKNPSSISSISLETEQNSSYNLLVEERYFNKHKLTITNEEAATKKADNSDICEDIGFGIMMAGLTSVIYQVLKNDVSDGEQFIWITVSFGLGVGSDSACTSLFG